MNLGKATRRLGIFLLFMSAIGAIYGFHPIALVHPLGTSSEITGQVSDQRGRGLSALFVSARHQATGRTTHVLTKAQGRFRIPALEPGTYAVRVNARGWEGPPQEVDLKGARVAPLGFSLKPLEISAPQLTSAELLPLLPEGEGKELLLSNCIGCHTVQMFAPHQWDIQGWRKNVTFMRKVFGATLPEGKDETLASYLTDAFAPTSSLRTAAAKAAPHQGRTANVIYTAWDIPLSKALPHTATLDQRGSVWFTDAYGSRLGRLEVATGKFKTWNAPTPNSIPHGIVVDQKGKIWFTERLQFAPANKIVKLDPETEKLTEFPLPRNISGPHTLIFDKNGILWITEYEGNRIARFEPETEKFTEYDVPTKNAKPYGIDIDKDGVLWIAEIGSGALGKLDPRIGKVVDYPTPTPNSGVRRVRADSKGRIWFTEFLGDRLGMFDPKTEKMTEYLMPGIRPQPYALEVTSDDKIWLSTWHQDVMMKFDPDTRAFTAYPVPFLDLEIRDFRIDENDALWFVAMIPNKVVRMQAR